MENGPVLRVGEIAKLIGVSTNQVVKYCKAGKLKYHLVPKHKEGQRNQHRRFEVREVYRFLKEYGVPLTVIEERFPFLKEPTDENSGPSSGT